MYHIPEKVKRMKVRKCDVVKARKEADGWMRGGRGRSAVMMLDISDGCVWTDCFIDENSSKVYQSDTIVEIPVGWITQDTTRDHPLTTKEIDEAIYRWCNDRMTKNTKTTQDVYNLVNEAGLGDGYFEELLSGIGKEKGDNVTHEELRYIRAIIDMDRNNLRQ